MMGCVTGSLLQSVLARSSGSDPPLRSVLTTHAQLFHSSLILSNCADTLCIDFVYNRAAQRISFVFGVNTRKLFSPDIMTGEI